MEFPLQIGVTGGIGSGKTVVCRIFNALGAPVYDADSHAKELMMTNPLLKSQIQNEFGAEAFSPDGRINRSLIARMVFGKPERLEKLNKLVHPCVEHDYQQWVKMFSGRPYVIKEAALLLESGSVERLDKLVVVISPVNLRVRRVLQRDPHRTEEDIRNIMESQMPEGEKLKRANFTVTNDETILVIPQVLKLHELFSTGL